MTDLFFFLVLIVDHTDGFNLVFHVKIPSFGSVAKSFRISNAAKIVGMGKSHQWVRVTCGLFHVKVHITTALWKELQYL